MTTLSSNFWTTRNPNSHDIHKALFSSYFAAIEIDATRVAAADIYFYSSTNSKLLQALLSLLPYEEWRQQQAHWHFFGFNWKNVKPLHSSSPFTVFMGWVHSSQMMALGLLPQNLTCTRPGNSSCNGRGVLRWQGWKLCLRSLPCWRYNHPSDKSSWHQWSELDGLISLNFSISQGSITSACLGQQVAPGHFGAVASCWFCSSGFNEEPRATLTLMLTWTPDGTSSFSSVSITALLPLAVPFRHDIMPVRQTKMTTTEFEASERQRHTTNTRSHLTNYRKGAWHQTLIKSASTYYGCGSSCTQNDRKNCKDIHIIFLLRPHHRQHNAGAQIYCIGLQIRKVQTK